MGIRIIALASLLLPHSGVALASPLHAVRSREPLPARLVERDLVMPKGWTSLSLEASRKVAGAVFEDEHSQALEVANQFRSVDLSIRHGLLPKVEGWMALHHREVSVHNLPGSPAGHAARSAAASGFAEPAFGLLGSVFSADAAGHYLAWEVGYQAGVSHVLAETQQRVTGFGGDTVHAAIRYRERIGGLRLDAGGGWISRLPIYAEAEQTRAWHAQAADPGPLRIDHGDGPFAETRALLQAGPLWGAADARLRMWGPYAERTLDGARVENRDQAATSTQRTVDLGASAGVQLTRGATVSLHVEGPVDRKGEVLGFDDSQLGPRWRVVVSACF